MRVLVYPMDREGCGFHRLIAPCQELQKQGYDVVVKDSPQDAIAIGRDKHDRVVEVQLPKGHWDVVVLQRTTYFYTSQVIPILQKRGVAVVVDVDDDLHSIHPWNPAFEALHPKRGYPNRSWNNLMTACQTATLVTTTTPLLQSRYAAHGRGVVLPNYLADRYFGIEHEDSDVIGWPASLHSHPNDPSAVGNALRRLEQDGIRTLIAGDASHTARLFGLQEDMDEMGVVPIQQWPAKLAQLGIGIAPLADTKFNAAKSWLKPLEMSAVGVPWVGSPRAEYVKLRELGPGGILVDSPGSWYAALSMLHKNEVMRKEMSEAGREVAETLRLRDHATKWWDAWTEAFDLQLRGWK